MATSQMDMGMVGMATWYVPTLKGIILLTIIIALVMLAGGAFAPTARVVKKCTESFTQFMRKPASSSKKETFRYLKEPVREPEAPYKFRRGEFGKYQLPDGWPGEEIPTGGMSAKYPPNRTSWFSREGRTAPEPGMDVIQSATEMKYDRPQALDIYDDNMSPAGRKGPVREEEGGLLPENATRDLLNQLGPDQPIMTSNKEKNNDLSGRDQDFENPRAEADINNTSTPVPADSFSSYR